MDCGTHGNCTAAQCTCVAGYTGDHCEHGPCFFKLCGDHGRCDVVGSRGICVCEPGHFLKSNSSTQSCESCQVGSVTNTLSHWGATTCTGCMPGRFGALPTLRCQHCQAGTFNAEATGMAACAACSAGSQTSASDGSFVPTGAVGCSACAAGTFSADTTGSAECAACSAGSQTSASDGSFVPTGAVGCSACAAGTFSADTTGSAECAACSAGSQTSASDGSFVATAFATSCSACAAGTFSPEPTTACSFCASGYFSDSDGRASCTGCMAGQYNTRDVTKCEMCAHGSVTNKLNAPSATACTPCTPGLYSTDSTVSCAVCNAGDITDTLASSGATLCSHCGAGQFSSSSQTACQTCPSGHITNTLAQFGASDCAECQVGRFSPVSTMSCTQCEPGGASTPLGQTACTCDDGFTGNACETCSASFWCHGRGVACELSPIDAHPQCTCRTGWSGGQCESCSGVEFCNSQGSCQPQSTIGVGVSCACDLGFQGMHCDACAANYFPSRTRCASLGCATPCQTFCEATLSCQTGEMCNADGHCERCPRGWEYNAVDVRHGGSDIRCDTMVEVIVGSCTACDDIVCPPDIPTMMRRRWAAKTCDYNCDHALRTDHGCYSCTNPEQWVNALSRSCTPATCRYNTDCGYRALKGYGCYSSADTCTPDVVDAIGCMPAGSVNGQSCMDTERTSCRWVNISWAQDC